MQAALELFATHGVDSVNIRTIAEKANYTNPALFRHFASKDKLAQALFEACYRKLQAAIVTGARRDGWRGIIKSALELIDEAPDGVHYVLETLRRHWPHLPRELRAASLPSLVRTAITSDQSAGRIRAEIDADMAATVLLGTLGQIARAAHFEKPRKAAASRAAVLGEIIANGIEE